MSKTNKFITISVLCVVSFWALSQDPCADFLGDRDAIIQCEANR